MKSHKVNCERDIFVPGNYISENMKARKVRLNQRTLFIALSSLICCGLCDCRALSLIQDTQYSQAAPLWASGVDREMGLWFVSPGVRLFQTLELEGKRIIN